LTARRFYKTQCEDPVYKAEVLGIPRCPKGRKRNKQEGKQLLPKLPSEIKVHEFARCSLGGGKVATSEMYAGSKVRTNKHVLAPMQEDENAQDVNVEVVLKHRDSVVTVCFYFKPMYGSKTSMLAMCHDNTVKFPGGGYIGPRELQHKATPKDSFLVVDVRVP
jgi:hypothetical protein